MIYTRMIRGDKCGPRHRAIGTSLKINQVQPKWAGPPGERPITSGVPQGTPSFPPLFYDCFVVVVVSAAHTVVCSCNKHWPLFEIWGKGEGGREGERKLINKASILVFYAQSTSTDISERERERGSYLEKTGYCWFSDPFDQKFDSPATVCGYSAKHYANRRTGGWISPGRPVTAIRRLS